MRPLPYEPLLRARHTIAVGIDGPGSALRSGSGSRSTSIRKPGASGRGEHVTDRARVERDALAVAIDGHRRALEVGAAHLEEPERQGALAGRVASGAEGHRVLVGEDEGRAEPQHAVHLTEDTVEILDLAQGEHAEHQIDRVGAQEGKIGEISAVPLDPDLLGLGELARPRELRRRCVERDGVHALEREGDRGLAGAATEVEHPLALQVAEQAQLLLARQLGPVADGAEARRRAGHRRESVPGLGIEDPGTYIVRIEWDSVEGHEQGFRKSSAFGEFFSAVKPFFDDIEEMRHYQSLLDDSGASS